MMPRNFILRQTSGGFETIPQPKQSTIQRRSTGLAQRKNPEQSVSAGKPMPERSSAAQLYSEQKEYGQSKYEHRKRRPKKQNQEGSSASGKQMALAASPEIADLSTGIHAAKKKRSPTRRNTDSPRERFAVPVIKPQAHAHAVKVVATKQQKKQGRNIPRPAEAF
eukprot:SAG11_NODE_4334_length_1944_cov_2.118157_2_plen_165_part_00